MFLAIALISGMFMVDNSEFLNTVKKNQEDGYTWHHVGKTTPSGVPAITVVNSATGEESIYFKMKVEEK